MTSATYARATDTLPRTRPGSTGTATATRRPSARSAALVAAGTVAVVAVSVGVGYRLHQSATTSPVGGGPAVARSDAAESGHGRGTAIVTGTGVPLASTATAPMLADGSDALVLVHGQSGSLALASGTSLASPARANAVNRAPVTPTALDVPAHGTADSVVTSSGPISR